MFVVRNSGRMCVCCQVVITQLHSSPISAVGALFGHCNQWQCVVEMCAYIYRQCNSFSSAKVVQFYSVVLSDCLGEVVLGVVAGDYWLKVRRVVLSQPPSSHPPADYSLAPVHCTALHARGRKSFERSLPDGTPC